MISINMQAFLNTIAFSELGNLASRPDRGASMIVGSRPGHEIKLHDYSDHPRVTVHINGTIWSTAAGCFQIKSDIYDHYRKLLNLPDFSYDSQRAIAIHLINEQGGAKFVEEGRIDLAMQKVNNTWVSLPGSSHTDQHQNKEEYLLAYYKVQVKDLEEMARGEKG